MLELKSPFLANHGLEQNLQLGGGDFSGNAGHGHADKEGADVSTRDWKSYYNTYYCFQTDPQKLRYLLDIIFVWIC